MPEEPKLVWNGWTWVKPEPPNEEGGEIPLFKAVREGKEITCPKM